MCENAGSNILSKFFISVDLIFSQVHTMIRQDDLCFKDNCVDLSDVISTCSTSNLFDSYEEISQFNTKRINYVDMIPLGRL